MQKEDAIQLPNAIKWQRDTHSRLSEDQNPASTGNTRGWGGCGASGIHSPLVGMKKPFSYFETRLDGCLKKQNAI